jgi:hypothetical protein
MDRNTKIRNLEIVVLDMLDDLKKIGYTGEIKSFKSLSRMVKKHHGVDKIKYLSRDFKASARLLSPDYSDDGTEILSSEREAQGRLFDTYRIILPSRKNPRYWSRRGILEQFHPTFNNVINMDDFSNSEHRLRTENNPYFQGVSIGTRETTLRHFHDTHYMKLLGHELGHLLHFCDKSKWTPKISRALGGDGDVLTRGGLEFFAELFATTLLFPPEQEYSESRKDILEIGDSPTFLEGIVNLSHKRKLGVSSILERLSSSQLFKEKFSNCFALQFRNYLGNLYLLETNIFPEEISFHNESSKYAEPSEFFYRENTNGLNFSEHLLGAFDINPRIWDFSAAKYKTDPRLKGRPFYIEKPYFVDTHHESFFETLILSIKDQSDNPILTLDSSCFENSGEEYPLIEINSCGQYGGKHSTCSRDERGYNYFLVAGKVRI